MTIQSQWVALMGLAVALLPLVASEPIPLCPYLNSRATSLEGENDGVGFRNGSTFPASYLLAGTRTHEGVEVSRLHKLSTDSSSFSSNTETATIISKWMAKSSS
jgi:hypothetical protein